MTSVLDLVAAHSSRNAVLLLHCCVPVVFRIRGKLLLAQFLYGAQTLWLGGYTLGPLFARPGDAVQERCERFGHQVLAGRRRRRAERDGDHVMQRRQRGRGGRHRVAEREHALEHVQMRPELLDLVVPVLQQRFQVADYRVLRFQQSLRVLRVHRSRHVCKINDRTGDYYACIFKKNRPLKSLKRKDVKTSRARRGRPNRRDTLSTDYHRAVD